jgi:serine protease inhibitor
MVQWTYSKVESNLQAILCSQEEKNVQVKLPRLRIRHSAPLVETLTQMGLTDLFDASKSNLSRISDISELHVSSIAHK